MSHEVKQLKKKLSVVGVIGSGTDRHEEWSFPLGCLLAELGVHLLTGGGQGVMAAVCESFVAMEGRAGLCLGILPSREEGDALPATGYPNEFVELVVQTHLPGRGAQGGTVFSRNPINIASSHAVVVLPGGAGTKSEVEWACQMSKPVVGVGGAFEELGIPQARNFPELESLLRLILRER